MQIFPPTVVWRHRKENLKKCSLRGLESRGGFRFFQYPNQTLPDLVGYVLLDMEGEPLSDGDRHAGLVVLDATWRYAEKMRRALLSEHTLPKRRLPRGLATAYPRCQSDCPVPDEGLASIEAIYSAYFILRRHELDLLDAYYWKESFLQKNKTFFTRNN